MEKIKKLFNNISNYLTIFALILLLGFFSFASIRIRINEAVGYISFNYHWVVFFLLHLIFLHFILKYSNKISEKKLFISLAIIYLLVGIYLIINISSLLRADTGAVYKTVRDMRHDYYGFFQPKNYMNFYPHQHGLVYYIYLITSIVDKSKIIFSVNLVEIIIINFMIYKIVDILGNSDKRKNLLAIYLSFAFTQQLFFIAFAYNLIPGFFFMINGLYLLLSYKKNGNIYRLISSIILFAIAVIIRNNFIIMVIAAFLYLWLTSDKNKKILPIIFLISFLVISKTFTFGMNSLTEHITGVKVSKGMPKILWLAMGTDPTNLYPGPGWYNNYTRIVLENVDYDLDKAAEIGKEKVKDNFNKFIHNPLYGLGFFGTKHLSTWADPTFQSIWSGPLPRYGQSSQNKIIQSIYYEGTIYWANYHYMKSITVLLYLGSLIYLLKKNLHKNNLSLFIIYFVGGTVFHLFWETKSQYVYTYVIMLIPVAIEAIIDSHEKFLQSNLYKRLKKI
ncbi:hypothetical protein ACKA04_08260 [Helcococcus kunzii]|uniref:hypothetical protein n=1 Tax=Helcococcus kunzii TaxID=40091 RepID=UPI0038A9E2A7